MSSLFLYPQPPEKYFSTLRKLFFLIRKTLSFIDPDICSIKYIVCKEDCCF